MDWVLIEAARRPLAVACSGRATAVRARLVSQCKTHRSVLQSSAGVEWVITEATSFHRLLAVGSCGGAVSSCVLIRGPA